MSNIYPFDPGRVGRYCSAVRFAQVRSVIEDRARRAHHFRSSLFAEPAWDILLELYALELAQHAVTVSQLADRISVPSTTSARWMKMLEIEGYVIRTVDPNEPARLWVALTPKGLEAMDGYFSEKR